MGRVWRRFGCRRGMVGKRGMGVRLGRKRSLVQVPQGLMPSPRQKASMQDWKACSTLFKIAPDKIASDKIAPDWVASDRAVPRFVFPARWGVLWIASFV